MTFDYFYGQQAELFSFYRVPKVLFTDDSFWNVSTDAKLLYEAENMTTDQIISEIINAVEVP